MRKLDELLQKLDSRDFLRSEFNRADEAVRTFEIDETVITDWDKFRYCMAKFRWHLDYHLLNMNNRITFDPSYQWLRAIKLLNDVYGQNGEKAAFEIVRTGNEGGLYSILKEMATQQIVQYCRNRTSAFVGRFWDGLSVDEKIQAGRDYIDRYRDILPSELTERSGARILANLPNVLRKHPEMMHRLRSSSR